MVDKNKHGEIVKAESKNLDFYYADGTQALKNVSLPVYENKITALIGPSGCCLLYTSPSPRDLSTSRMPSSA